MRATRERERTYEYTCICMYIYMYMYVHIHVHCDFSVITSLSERDSEENSFKIETAVSIRPKRERREEEVEKDVESGRK